MANLNRSHHPFLVSCLLEIFLLLLGLGLVWALGVPVAKWIAWHPRWLPAGLAGTVPLLLIMIWFSKTQWAPMARIRRFVDEVLKPFLGQLNVLQLLIIAIAAGICEEFFFRAFLQVWLTEMTGPAAGLILASIVFGACHLVTPFYGVLATLIGVYLGGLMLYTGSVWPPAIAHFLYDFIALLWLVKANK